MLRVLSLPAALCTTRLHVRKQSEYTEWMKTITLSAVYDGERIKLDEPHELEPNTRLWVTVIPDELERERREWAAFSLQNLARAYGPDEPEYTDDMLIERNPLYEDR
jgi:hypothetical protein